MDENVKYPKNFGGIFGKVCLHYGLNMDEVGEARDLIKAKPEDGIKSYMAMWEEIKPTPSGINERMRNGSVQNV